VNYALNNTALLNSSRIMFMIKKPVIAKFIANRLRSMKNLQKFEH